MSVEGVGSVLGYGGGKKKCGEKFGGGVEKCGRVYGVSVEDVGKCAGCEGR